MRRRIAAVAAVALATLTASCATALTTAMINAAPSAPQVTFTEERKPADGMVALRAARSAAIWLDATMMRDGFVEAVEASTAFERVVGPASVDQKLQTRPLSGATRSEQQAIAAQVAGELGVDQLLMVYTDAPTVSSNGIILPNATVQYVSRVSLVDRGLQREVWGATVSTVLPNGMKVPSQREIGAALAAEITKKLKAARST